MPTRVAVVCRCGARGYVETSGMAASAVRCAACGEILQVNCGGSWADDQAERAAEGLKERETWFNRTWTRTLRPLLQKIRTS